MSTAPEDFASYRRSAPERKRVLELEQLWQELEWRRCANDIRYFFRTYVWIEDKQGTGTQEGRKLFELDPHQEEDLEALLGNKFVLVLKARQLGISTLVMAFALHKMLFQPGVMVKVLSKDEDGAKENLRRLQEYLRWLPAWQQQRAGVGSKGYKDGTGHVHLPINGRVSIVTSAPTTPTSAAGTTADLVVLDEFGLVENYQADIFNTIKPTLDAAASNPANKGVVCVVLSTARGGHTFYALLCKAAMQGKSYFKFVFHPWWVSRFCDADQREEEAKLYAEQGMPWKIFSERPSSPEEAFRESGNPRFSNLPLEEDCPEWGARGTLRVIRGCELTKGGVEFVLDDEGDFYINEFPIPNESYELAADTAKGVGGDNTVAMVGRKDEDGGLVLCGRWIRNDKGDTEQAEAVQLLGYFYAGRFESARVGVEVSSGGHGATMCYILQREQYPRMYFHRPISRRLRKRAATVGFPMDQATKPATLGRLAEMVPFIDGYFPLLRWEMGSFVRKPDGRQMADTGMHDDTVLCLAILTWMLMEDGAAQPPQDAHIDEGTTPEGEQVFSVKHLLDDAKRKGELNELRLLEEQQMLTERYEAMTMRTRR